MSILLSQEQNDLSHRKIRLSHISWSLHCHWRLFKFCVEIHLPTFFPLPLYLTHTHTQITCPIISRAHFIVNKSKRNILAFIFKHLLNLMGFAMFIVKQLIFSSCIPLRFPSSQCGFHVSNRNSKQEHKREIFVSCWNVECPGLSLEGTGDMTTAERESRELFGKQITWRVFIWVSKIPPSLSLFALH